MNVGDKFGIYTVITEPGIIHIKGFTMATLLGVEDGKVKVGHEGGETLIAPEVLQTANDLGDAMVVSTI